MTKKQRARRLRRATIQVCEMLSKPPLVGDRVMLRKSHPVLGGKAGVILEIGPAFGAHLIRVRLDAPIGRAGVQLSVLLSDCLLLEDGLGRPQAKPQPVDTNPWVDCFGN